MTDIYDSYLAKFLPVCGPKILITTVMYPLEMTKVLIQLGHEPIAPVDGRSFFNKPVKKLPNAFKYVQHIGNKDGLIGCFRGLSPRLCSCLLTTIISNEIEEYFDKKNSGDSSSNAEEEEPSKEIELLNTLKKKLTINVVTITITQPLHVVTVRMIAQFVGRETKYNGIFSSLWTIFKEEGVLGFFSGFVPRLLGEVSFVVLYETMFYVAKKLIETEEGVPDSMAGLLLDFLIRNYLYPFHVLSACMSVNGCGLMAGQAPAMPHYSNWIDCYRHIKAENGLSRGSGLLMRETFIRDVVTYPFEYASFLVQIGYRPESTFVGNKSLLRRSIGFTSITNTVEHIYRTDGLLGCYNGMKPFLCSQFISKAIIRLCCDKFHPHEKCYKAKSVASSTLDLSNSDCKIDYEEECEVQWKPVCIRAAIDLIAQLTAITISHPFTIVSYRMMAQFVGREQKYTGIFSSLCTIYKDQGSSGFFVGLAPQLIRQMISFASVSALLFILEKCTRKHRTHTFHEFSYFISDMAIRNLTYPLHIVSVLTAANDHELRSVSPPLMPDFEGDWIKCWNYMSKTGQLKRVWFPVHRYSQKMPAKSILLSVDELD
ncbi:hypothetical protein LSTR_LSTR002189 [Laodelphax striatellus]|uniref:Mitochondrial carrier-like protein 2 n=1 Tax=Laodelphax striatellus TaxID=195883 RepID=A0A482XQ62_LAOST|nr:hypothetical protein LSTR_LSTR002189 [Laodelphax striatellus]